MSDNRSALDWFNYIHQQTTDEDKVCALKELQAELSRPPTEGMIDGKWLAPWLEEIIKYIDNLPITYRGRIKWLEQTINNMKATLTSSLPTQPTFTVDEVVERWNAHRKGACEQCSVPYDAGCCTMSDCVMFTGEIGEILRAILTGESTGER